MSANPETIVVSPVAPERLARAWLSRWATQYAPHAKILNGSIVLLIGSVFVSLANFGYNIGVARLLGPSDFSHAAAAVTILMLVSALTLSFQLVCAKLVAKANTREQKAAVYQHLRKRAWAIGLALGAFMLIANSPLDRISATVDSLDHHSARHRTGHLCPVWVSSAADCRVHAGLKGSPGTWEPKPSLSLSAPLF